MTIEQDGWCLKPASDPDIDELMGRFPDAASVDIWGGPEFRFPFTRESFCEDCHLEKVLQSFSLHDPDGRMASFGQLYNRQERGHLARLISNPDMRRKGAGRRLIALLIRVASDQEISQIISKHMKAESNFQATLAAYSEVREQCTVLVNQEFGINHY